MRETTQSKQSREKNPKTKNVKTFKQKHEATTVKKQHTER
jgi:hypothetical protein